MYPLSSQPLHGKRPRGLWKGRREAAVHAEPKAGIHSHDCELDSVHSASTSSHGGDCFDDDLDDGHSSDSSSKRRRLSGALSDSETLWHHSPTSRSLTPDLCYNAPYFPTQILKSPPYSPRRKLIKMQSPPESYSSINSEGKGKQPSVNEWEDWENLKELFARASEAYDYDTTEALPLLRAVIRECHRFMVVHPDPSVIFFRSTVAHRTFSPSALTPTEERLTRDWTPDSLDRTLSPKPTHGQSLPSSRLHSPYTTPDPPTAFHALFGTALFYMGTVISQDPAVALPDEPATASTYWLAALDVFETGENLPSVIDSKSTPPEDWRMAVSWGRTLVSLADLKVEHNLRGPKTKPSALPAQSDLRNGWYSYQPQSAGPFSLAEPRWPTNSPFHAIAAARPPVTRRMSLYSATAHDVMVLAMDQFSKGIFHMPHPHYSHTHNPTSLHMDAPFAHGTGFSSAFHSRRHRTFSSTSPPPLSSAAVAGTLAFSRPKELFTIASEVLGVSERLSKAGQREYWASQADSVFNQMKMEADMNEWRMAVNAARGRCWLVVGEARAEEMENALERGELSVLHTPEAEEAREGLAMAITFFERAKGSATAKPNPEQEDLAPLLAEALLTLANLTADEKAREELYARAQAEGGDTIHLELDPPPSALPASISSIAAVAKRQSSFPSLDNVADDLNSSARTFSLEASPAIRFPNTRSSPSMLVDNALGLDQPMLVDHAFSRREEYMDES